MKEIAKQFCSGTVLKACLMNVHKWLCLSNFLPFPKGQLCLNKRPSDRVHFKLPSCVSDTVVVMKPLVENLEN